MKFTFRIAWRYIFSKKSTNAINIISGISMTGIITVSYTHLRAHETVLDLVCRLLLEKKKNKNL